jgi:hypothetical protein
MPFKTAPSLSLKLPILYSTINSLKTQLKRLKHILHGNSLDAIIDFGYKKRVRKISNPIDAPSNGTIFRTIHYTMKYTFAQLNHSFINYKNGLNKFVLKD